jgi:hypothetical protein
LQKGLGHNATVGASPVPDYTAISDTSLTLRQVLEDGLSALPIAPSVVVHNLRSDPQPPVVTLFLYEVIEDPSARNRPRVRELVGNSYQVRKPNLALLLRYLVTPWIDDMNPPYTDQLILGRLSQVLYEKPILRGLDLQGKLRDTNEALKVTLAPITLEDRTRIWNSLQLRYGYRLSLTYEVRVVNIEAENSHQVQPVVQGRFGYGDLVGAEP